MRSSEATMCPAVARPGVVRLRLCVVRRLRLCEMRATNLSHQRRVPSDPARELMPAEQGSRLDYSCFSSLSDILALVFR